MSLSDEGDRDSASSISYASNDDDNDDASSEDEAVLSQRHRLLFLCQEGQLRIARQRFSRLNDEDGDLQREIFQVARDKNYPLHEILMGGTSDTNARLLAMAILTICSSNSSWRISYMRMLEAQPPSHQRTALHWAAWGNASLEIMKHLVRGNPEALVLRDKPSQGCRTPLQLYRHYYCAGDSLGYSQDSLEKLEYFQSCTNSWIQHRLRNTIYACAVHYFRNHRWTPFSLLDRKEVGIKPKPWFLLSILGYLLQREMQPLVLRIVSFVGHQAKHQNSRKRKQRSKNGSKD